MDCAGTFRGHGPHPRFHPSTRLRTGSDALGGAINHRSSALQPAAAWMTPIQRACGIIKRVFLRSLPAPCWWRKMLLGDNL